MYYLNTGTQMQLFQKIVNSEIYVDKSLLIDKISSKIKTANQYICITRPRRFGKSVNANMLGAYYTKGCDGAAVFDRLAIAGTAAYSKHMNKYNVIYIDLSKRPDVCESYKEYIGSLIKNLRADLLENYPELGGREYDGVSQMFLDTKDSFIFILDEWDSVFYEKYMGEEDKVRYLKFLKGLLKDQPYVELAYMTGVLPIVKYCSGSELNMFAEYHFANDDVYESYFGLGEDEVRELCKTHGRVSYEELEWWYDGYYMSDGTHLFNPRSVNRALMDGVCKNYWTETGPMNEVSECVEHNVDAVREDIVKMVSGIPVELELDGYSAASQHFDNREEILSAMVVYGFLSYHEGFLCIPNRELMEKYQRMLARESMGEIKEIVDKAKECENILLVGISYDKDKGKHRCLIEEYAVK